MKYDITLYGSNSDAVIAGSTSSPAKSTVTGLSDVVTWSPDVLNLEYIPELTSGGNEYLNNSLDSTYSVRGKWRMKVKAKQFPVAVSAYSNATSLQTYFPIDLLNKQYHYLYFGNKYPLQPSETIASETCLAVAVTSVQIEDMDGLKSLIVEMKYRFTGV
jgi:hypothetical protein